MILRHIPSFHLSTGKHYTDKFRRLYQKGCKTVKILNISLNVTCQVHAWQRLKLVGYQQVNGWAYTSTNLVKRNFTNKNQALTPTRSSLNDPKCIYTQVKKQDTENNHQGVAKADKGFANPNPSKRPRDLLLRDKEYGKELLEIRQKNAFKGYTYRRPYCMDSFLSWGMYDLALRTYLIRLLVTPACLSVRVFPVLVIDLVG